ncbi:MAG TPA: transcription antitermination factor NusB [Anaerolineales bacterium]|nr:transcription antitermination factor NusB [Anaerolineales bacterium]
MKPRTRARAVALQVLYEIDIVDHKPEIALHYRLQETALTEDLAEFCRTIIRSIAPIRPLLDAYIAEHASDWPIDQVATIDRNILRIALWELTVYTQTPTKVAINEAIELAKTYGSESAPRFVNGVLGALAEREHEIRQALKNHASLASDPGGSPD